MSPARIATLVVLVGSVALLGLLGYRMARPGTASTLVGVGRVNTSGRIADVERRPASDFALRTFDGGKLTLSELRGEVVVLNFWSSWCPPCRAEAPALEAAWRHYRGQGVVVLGIDVWDEDRAAKEFLLENGITYPNGVPDSPLAAEYGLTGIPETFVVDREGMVVRRWIGPATESQLGDLIRAAGVQE